ncbi:MAG: DUF1761 domain-containing protein [Gloeobacteraceae cyanobacterium ES-bin-316]|nr:DUF1761 domain-containing protein [Ferruginibacter sp.]
MDTSFLSQLNWLAVLCAALAYFAVGALWYSKILFATKWLALTKIDASNPDATKGMVGIMLFSFFVILLNSIGLGILQYKLQLSAGWLSGLKLGILTGLCFGATAISNSYTYEKRPTGLHLINGGYTIAGNIIAAIIICTWP